MKLFENEIFGHENLTNGFWQMPSFASND